MSFFIVFVTIPAQQIVQAGSSNLHPERGCGPVAIFDRSPTQLCCVGHSKATGGRAIALPEGGIAKPCRAAIEDCCTLFAQQVVQGLMLTMHNVVVNNCDLTRNRDSFTCKNVFKKVRLSSSHFQIQNFAKYKFYSSTLYMYLKL
jgi:hypothetical protein